MMTPEEQAIHTLQIEASAIGIQQVNIAALQIELLEEADKNVRDVNGRVEATGGGRRRSWILSQDTTLELPVLLAGVALVFLCRGHVVCMAPGYVFDGSSSCGRIEFVVPARGGGRVDS